MNRTLVGIVAACLVASSGAVAQSSGKPTNQSAEEIVIKEKLNVAGVTKLNALTRERDGSWRGRGVKDNIEVAVVVDTDGNVIFQ